MTEREEMDQQAKIAVEAFEEATWDAILAYRPTGEMVPTMKDGKLALVTVDEALRSRHDYERRIRETAEKKRQTLITQFAEAGLELTPDVWERMRADRRQALEDDLAWMHP